MDLLTDDISALERILAEIQAEGLASQMFDPPYERIAIAGRPVADWDVLRLGVGNQNRDFPHFRS